MTAGRPTDYSAELADEICERMSGGESLRTICNADEMPNRATVFRWLAKHEEFATIYARACEVRAEVLADEILDIADDGSNDWIERKNADGENIGYRENGEAIRRSQLRVASRQWVAEKMLPKKYGAKVQAMHTGKDGERLTVVFSSDDKSLL